MKKIIVLFSIVSISFNACLKNTKNTVLNNSNSDTTKNSSTILLHEGLWISNFKNEIFIRCLKNKWERNSKNCIDSLDGSTAANLDWLNYNEKLIYEIDSLVNEVTKRKEFKWVIEDRKVTINVSLDYRLSKELDSTAVNFYKKYNPNN